MSLDCSEYLLLWCIDVQISTWDFAPAETADINTSGYLSISTGLFQDNPWCLGAGFSRRIWKGRWSCCNHVKIYKMEYCLNFHGRRSYFDGTYSKSNKQNSDSNVFPGIDGNLHVNTIHSRCGQEDPILSIPISNLMICIYCKWRVQIIRSHEQYNTEVQFFL